MRYCHMQKISQIGQVEVILWMFLSMHQKYMYFWCILKNIHKITPTCPIWLIFCMWQYLMSSLGVLMFLEAYTVCMHACMHVHARMQISHGASTRCFNYVILELHAKNQVSMTMDVLIISLWAWISDSYLKTFIKSLLLVQFGWFFACGNIPWVPWGFWCF